MILLVIRYTYTYHFTDLAEVAAGGGGEDVCNELKVCSRLDNQDARCAWAWASARLAGSLQQGVT